MTRTHPGRHLASKHPRGVRAIWCRCGRPIMRGLDDDHCASVVSVDIQPLTILGEALARIQGRNTYELRLICAAIQLMRRNRLTIISRPPGSRIWCGDIDVVAEHACYALDLPGRPSVHQPRNTTTRKADDAPCPY